ncbi:MAG: hypothetical protein O6950_11545 [Gammaproteobacteria bacterium]|nr:hypothetical protein [Gammaproteobacteria bacterium]
MKGTDARSLPPAAREDLRRKAVKAVRGGMTQVEAVRLFDVTRRATQIATVAIITHAPGAGTSSPGTTPSTVIRVSPIPLPR